MTRRLAQAATLTILAALGSIATIIAVMWRSGGYPA
jgi:hypothetical protein